jgi:hypothetical protein
MCTTNSLMLHKTRQASPHRMQCTWHYVSCMLQSAAAGGMHPGMGLPGMGPAGMGGFGPGGRMGGGPGRGMPPRGPPGQIFGGPRPYMDRCGCWLCNSWCVASVACVVLLVLCLCCCRTGGRMGGRMGGPGRGMPPRGPPGQLFGAPRPYMGRCGCQLCNSWCSTTVVSEMLSYAWYIVFPVFLGIKGGVWGVAVAL